MQSNSIDKKKDEAELNKKRLFVMRTLRNPHTLRAYYGLVWMDVYANMRQN